MYKLGGRIYYLGVGMPIKWSKTEKNGKLNTVCGESFFFEYFFLVHCSFQKPFLGLHFFGKVFEAALARAAPPADRSRRPGPAVKS